MDEMSKLETFLRKEGAWDKFVANGGILNPNIPDTSGLISRAFNWAKSDEGSLFWIDIAEGWQVYLDDQLEEAKAEENSRPELNINEEAMVEKETKMESNLGEGTIVDVRSEVFTTLEHQKEVWFTKMQEDMSREIPAIYTEYYRGSYNSVETALALMQIREPKYLQKAMR